MIRILTLLIGLALAGVAQAQIKCWTVNGKRACGDTPPPGARLETPRGAPAPARQDPAPVAKDTKKEAQSSTPQDQEIRKRQNQNQSEKAKAYLAKKGHTDVNATECERAKELLAAMKGGGRSKRTDAVKARALAENNCP